MPAKPVSVLALLTLFRCSGAITLPVEALGLSTPTPYVTRRTSPDHAARQQYGPYFASRAPPRHPEAPTYQHVHMVQVPQSLPLQAGPQQQAPHAPPHAPLAEPHAFQVPQSLPPQAEPLPQAPAPPHAPLAEPQLAPQAKTDGQKVWDFPAEFPVSALSPDSRQRLDQWTAKLHEQSYMRAAALQQASTQRRSHENSPQPQRAQQPARAIHSPQLQQSQAPREAQEGPQHKLDKWMADLGGLAQSRANGMLQSARLPSYQLPEQGLPQFSPAALSHRGALPATFQAPPAMLPSQPAAPSQLLRLR